MSHEMTQQEYDALSEHLFDIREGLRLGMVTPQETFETLVDMNYSESRACCVVNMWSAQDKNPYPSDWLVDEIKRGVYERKV